MKIRFWGVRGSIPCPGPNTARYGGNTPCIELRIPPDNRLIIIDAGSGIREFGNYLMGTDFKKGPIDTDLYLTHTHWDHIMGFPFFTPIYLPTTRLRVFGPVTHEEDTLESIVGGQMTYRYFPVRGAELAAQIRYTNLKEGSFDLGDGLHLTTKYLNHPILCLSYRFEHQGRVFCTAYDTEPFRNVFCTNPDDPSYDEVMAVEGELVAKEQNDILERHFAGADLLIYDAQYTKAEYESSRLGWGHTAMEHACEAANRAGVKKLILFHHEPVRTDAQLDALAAIHGEPFRYGGVEVVFAREGMELEV